MHGQLPSNLEQKLVGNEQVREENPILYSHKTQLNIKLSLLQHYNNMFGLNYRPSSGCI